MTPASHAEPPASEQSDETITLRLADVVALVRLGWEMAEHIQETDQSATGSIYGIEYAHKTIARVAAKLPPAHKPITRF